MRTRDELVLVGEGRTAEILAWDEGRVLRLFRTGASRAYALRELHTSRAINEVGVPSPSVYPAETEDGLVEVDDRIGFVMERVDGPTMLRMLSTRPWKLIRFARVCARLHRTVHAASASNLPSQRERLHHVIERIAEDAGVGTDIAAQVHTVVDALPDGNVVCHGDFHPDNILMSSQGPVIIDWGPATSGNPAADVAWTVYLFRHGGTPPGMSLWQKLVLNGFRRLFLFVYLREYLKNASISRGDVERWGPPIAALRLADGIPEERDVLLQTIRSYFSSGLVLGS
jgi:aminoglycoside phosphotransferase (APT) family kinase protein